MKIYSLLLLVGLSYLDIIVKLASSFILTQDENVNAESVVPLPNDKSFVSAILK